MTRRSIALYLSLARQFRNAPELIRCVRSGSLCDSAVTWTGRTLTHPTGIPGFLDVLLEHWVFGSYVRDGFYTPCPGDVVLDIGAHIGLFSIQLARLCAELRVLAFEPSHDTFQCLRANLQSFGCDNVQTFRMALGSTHGQGQMRSGERTLDNVLEISHSPCGSFPVVPLAEMLEFAGSDRVALMKVDIEGSEKQAFQSVSPALLLRIDRIVLEYHDNLLPGSLDAVKKALSSTHETYVEPSSVAGCGILRGVLRQLPKSQGITQNLRAGTSCTTH